MKHFIAKSKLEKAKLSKKQIAQVYKFKSKAKQLAKAKSLISSVHATRVRKFYRTGLGKYVIEKRLEKLEALRKTPEWDKLPKQTKYKLEKEYFKKTNIRLSILARQAKTVQAKEDLLAARQDRLDKLRGRIVAGEKAYYINRSTQDSYQVNATVHKTMIEYVTAHYYQELDELMKDKQNPKTFDEAVQELWDKAVASGELQPLAQGVGYGYIDDSAKEVISPV